MEQLSRPFSNSLRKRMLTPHRPAVSARVNCCAFRVLRIIRPSSAMLEKCAVEAIFFPIGKKMDDGWGSAENFPNRENTPTTQ
jgi:hypothetical protein